MVTEKKLEKRAPKGSQTLRKKTATAAVERVETAVPSLEGAASTTSPPVKETVPAAVGPEAPVSSLKAEMLALLKSSLRIVVENGDFTSPTSARSKSCSTGSVFLGRLLTSNRGESTRVERSKRDRPKAVLKWNLVSGAARGGPSIAARSSGAVP